ncbi:MAG: hypothetical protein ACYC3I_20690 [Gemmataceae bacterium]
MVKVVDGTTVSMPDSPANQKAYPQAPTQKAGVGFPIARVVVLFSLAVGTVLDAARANRARQQCFDKTTRLGEAEHDTGTLESILLDVRHQEPQGPTQLQFVNVDVRISTAKRKSKKIPKK